MVNPICPCNPNMDIVTTLASSSKFTILIEAIKAAGLVTTLRGGPFTLFAPNNEAFEKLPKGTLDNLLRPENEATLVNILTYHVVPGVYELSDLCKHRKLKTVEGQSLKIIEVDCKPRVNCAKIKKCDICATNGIIYEINKVLIPTN